MDKWMGQYRNARLEGHGVDAAMAAADYRTERDAKLPPPPPVEPILNKMGYADKADLFRAFDRRKARAGKRVMS
jgi:hypothetical protein